jgi:hypothetical protein
MKIFVSHSSNINEEELYKPLREFALNTTYEFFLPHESKNLGNTKERIKGSDLVLAEVSLPSIGQGIELGWADIFNIPIVCVVKENTKTSGSLKFITNKFVIYKDSEDLMIQISNLLSSYSK